MRHVALVGLMGTGKTTVGRTVAQQLGWPFVDMDERIEAATGSTVRQLWERGGEDAYRPLEEQATLDALAEPGPSVVAVPGGAVLEPRVARALQRPDVVGVWLRGSPEVLVARAADGDHRPLLDGDPLRALTVMAAERAGTYDAVSAHVVDVDVDPPGVVAARVLSALAR